MITLSVILAVLHIVPAVFCFLDTVPVVAWSSRSSALPILSAAEVSTASAVIESILFNSTSCGYDVFVFVEHPGLRASDLRALPLNSRPSLTFRTALTARQYPYLSSSSASFFEVVESASRICQSHFISSTLSKSEPGINMGVKQFVHILLPELTGHAKERQALMAAHGARLWDEIDHIVSSHPDHLVVYAGSTTPSQLSKRQSTSPLLSRSDGLLHRYQFLNSALISGLLVTFFVLIPVTIFGIFAVASIQSPLRSEAPTGYSAHEKKNR